MMSFRAPAFGREESLYLCAVPVALKDQSASWAAVKNLSGKK